MKKLSSLPKDVLIKMPTDLPVPEDDGACNHLIARSIPSVELSSISGKSAQTTEDQLEAAQRLQLPYELLSDITFSFAKPLGLPVFEAGGMRLLKRVTLIAKAGRIEKYFYPVFPPDRNASEVLDWLRVHAV
jgi:peroxiredoxin